MSGSSLVLENFLPYRLSYLTNIISRKLAQLYTERFGINTHEWQIMANLHRYPDISAVEIGEKTVMGKVAVSRAVNGLCTKGLIRKRISRTDRRRSVLNITDTGQELYNQIEPLVINYENHLLDILVPEDLVRLDQLLTKLTHHASTGKNIP